MRMERTVREIAGDYAEGTVLIFENFEYRIKENMP